MRIYGYIYIKKQVLRVQIHKYIYYCMHITDHTTDDQLNHVGTPRLCMLRMGRRRGIVTALPSCFGLGSVEESFVKN
jgi:hypothetical protein